VLTLSLALRLSLLFIGALLAAGGGSSASARPATRSASQAEHGPVPPAEDIAPALRGPALIAVDGKGGLEYWPIDPKGGHHPQALIGGLHLGVSAGIAADGQRIAIPSGNEVVIYDLRSGAETMLPNPYGFPADIAIDKHGALFITDFVGSSSSITWYAPPSYRPHQLGCALLQDPTAIAIDNEGDIFTSQNGDNYTGVIEFPNPRRGGSQSCSELPLKPETGYEAGLAIDPKTDDLIVLDDPDECAGGVEGRMTIYAKPYRRQTGVSHDLGANCAGTLRLDATSTIAFVGDSTVSGGRGYILQRTYPDGKALGTYSGGSPAGFTTIPNTLPN
jgi:hypothetical protein